MNNEIIQLVQQINDIEYTCQAMLTLEYDQVLDQAVTNNQIIILNHVHDNEQILTGDLAKLMNISPSAISQMLNKMEKQKLVKRVTNPENRREIFVNLDSMGIEFLEKSRKVELDIIEKYYSKLSVSDLNSLKEIMLKFKKIIENEQLK